MIQGSYVSESLLAYILYRKYGLYVPLYRQEKDFLEQNAPIGRTTMASCIITVGKEYIQPIYDLFHRALLKRRFLMMDETPVQVLKEEGRRNWLFSDTPDGAAANALHLTMVEMAKAYGLNLYEYLKYLLEYRPSKDMSDEELSQFAP